VNISLIISTYNRKQLLIPLLQKLEEQTFKGFEVIVTDDGSSDGTINEVQDIVEHISYPLCIVTQKHKGFRAAKARNKGAKEARTKQLVFMDDDCIPNPNYLEGFHQAYSSNKLLRGDIIFVKSFDNLNEELFRHPGTKPSLWGASFSIPRRLFFKINGFDEEFINQCGEDVDLGRRLSRMKVKQIYVKNAYVYHLGRPLSGGQPDILLNKIKKHDHSIKRNLKKGK
jgi:GT2 family glycosyltransferase